VSRSAARRPGACNSGCPPLRLNSSSRCDLGPWIQVSIVLCCVNPTRYLHVVNTKRVRDRDRAPLSITNNCT